MKTLETKIGVFQKHDSLIETKNPIYRMFDHLYIEFVPNADFEKLAYWAEEELGNMFFDENFKTWRYRYENVLEFKHLIMNHFPNYDFKYSEIYLSEFQCYGTSLPTFKQEVVCDVLMTYGRWQLKHFHFERRIYGDNSHYDHQLVFTDGKQYFSSHYSHKHFNILIKSKDCLAALRRSRVLRIKADLQRRPLKGKTPFLNNPEAIQEIIGGTKYDWGTIISYNRGDRPTLYLPNELKYSKVNGNLVIHDCHIILDNKEGSYGDMRDLFGGRKITKFKFSKNNSQPKKDYMISFNRIDFLKGICRTTTNGGGHAIYIYDITGLDMTKQAGLVKI